jgi:DNA-binding transcriptional regulator YhcF (GntR family)
MLDHAHEGMIQTLRGKESDLNAVTVQKLAQELSLPAEVVQRTYEEVLEQMKIEARIRAFLPIFVSRRVREQLR